LNSGLFTFTADTLLLEPHLQFIIALVILEMESCKLFGRLASNYDPPDLSLTSS
jgi:hypothetical protein